MNEIGEFDVAIVGAGDVGAAIARELARFQLRVVLFDAGDVGAGTSKANTAILHTGFDAGPGTLEAKLVPRGHALLSAYAEQVGIPVERTGALLVAWNEAELGRLGEIEENACACGHEPLGRVSAEQLYEREPDLGPLLDTTRALAAVQGGRTVLLEVITRPEPAFVRPLT